MMVLNKGKKLDDIKSEAADAHQINDMPIMEMATGYPTMTLWYARGQEKACCAAHAQLKDHSAVNWIEVQKIPKSDPPPAVGKVQKELMDRSNTDSPRQALKVLSSQTQEKKALLQL